MRTFLPIVLASLTFASVSSALPPLPSADGTPPAPAAGTPPAAPGAPGAAADPAEKLRRGVVAIEAGGKPVAIGTVLANDGRIITSLSGLGTGEQFQIRYADNSTVQAKVGHKDADWDLALLVPQTARWKEGLSASELEPNVTDVRLMLPTRGKLGPVGVGFKGRTDAKSKGGTPLLNTLDLDMKGALSVPGAPVIDGRGNAIGVLVRACQIKSTAPCAPMSIAAPVSALRSFLIRTPATAVAPAPWLGLRGATSQLGSIKGVRVLDLAPGSPAEKAGLRANADPAKADMIVAVDGAPVETPEQIVDLVGKKGIGDTTKLLVFDGTKFREAPAVLRAAP